MLSEAGDLLVSQSGYFPDPGATSHLSSSSELSPEEVADSEPELSETLTSEVETDATFISESQTHSDQIHPDSALNGVSSDVDSLLKEAVTLEQEKGMWKRVKAWLGTKVASWIYEWGFIMEKLCWLAADDSRSCKSDGYW